MSIICKKIIDIVETLAPVCLAEEWDNVGLIVGRKDRQIDKILIALDSTEDVIDEAISIGAQMIITHHPLIFKPISQINDSNSLGRKILKIVENKICVYAAHTNLDIAQGGTNDELSKTLGLRNIEKMFFVDNATDSDDINGIGRKGVLSAEISLEEFANIVKQKLDLDSIRYVGEANKRVKTVGLSTGAASNSKNFKEAVKAGCDAFITGDIRFHEAQEALDLGLALIDATHYASENLVVNKLKEYIEATLSKEGLSVEIIASSVDGQVFKNK